MNLKAMYHSVRPMAKLHHGGGLRRPFPKVSPAVSFVACSVFSVIGGLHGGMMIWLMAGSSPESSGGALIFLLGACLMSLLSFFTLPLCKSRAVFYGLNFFTLLTVLILTLSALSTKIA